MFVGVLTTEFRDATGMVWVKVKLEPLMAETIVINLKAPFGSSLLIAELPKLGLSMVFLCRNMAMTHVESHAKTIESANLRWDLVAAHTLKATGTCIWPLNNDCLHVWLFAC